MAEVSASACSFMDTEISWQKLVRFHARRACCQSSSLVHYHIRCGKNLSCSVDALLLFLWAHVRSLQLVSLRLYNISHNHLIFLGLVITTIRWLVLCKWSKLLHMMLLTPLEDHGSIHASTVLYKRKFDVQTWIVSAIIQRLY
jgi:hypothetical protein